MLCILYSYAILNLDILAMPSNTVYSLSAGLTLSTVFRLDNKCIEKIINKPMWEASAMHNFPCKTNQTSFTAFSPLSRCPIFEKLAGNIHIEYLGVRALRARLCAQGPGRNGHFFSLQFFANLCKSFGPITTKMHKNT